MSNFVPTIFPRHYWLINYTITVQKTNNQYECISKLKKEKWAWILDDLMIHRLLCGFIIFIRQKKLI